VNTTNGGTRVVCFTTARTVRRRGSDQHHRAMYLFGKRIGEPRWY
jgi:hypothetical protein